MEYVLIPILSYVGFLAAGSYKSFRMIGRPRRSGGVYLRCLWQLMNFNIVIVLIMLGILYGADVLQDLLRHAATATAIFTVFFILFAALCLRVMRTVKDTSSLHDGWLDWLFFFSHIAMLVSGVYAFYTFWHYISIEHYIVNNDVMPYIWPFIVLSLFFTALPLMMRLRPMRDGR